MDTIIPADGQKLVIEELNARAGSPPNAAGRIPDDPLPDAFIRILPAGGFDRDIVTTVPTIIIESFALDDDTAATNLNDALAAMGAAARAGSMAGTQCYVVRFISMPSSLPMESLPTHTRYTATISAALRSTVV